MRTLENALRRVGFVHVAGVDEVGRGCLAGPVVAAAVVLHPDRAIPGVCGSKLVPAIHEEDLETGGAGVRAQAMSHDGGLVQDFAFVSRRNALHVLNAPSPAATASLAIGGEISRQVCEVL